MWSRTFCQWNAKTNQWKDACFLSPCAIAFPCLKSDSLSLRRHTHEEFAECLILKSLNTFQSRHLIGFYRTSSVSCFLTVRIETKPSWRCSSAEPVEFTSVILSDYEDQLNAGLSEWCEVYIIDLTFLICWSVVAHRSDFAGTSTLHSHVRKHDTNWLLYRSVKHPLGWSLASKSCYRV